MDNLIRLKKEKTKFIIFLILTILGMTFSVIKISSMYNLSEEPIEEPVLGKVLSVSDVLMSIIPFLTLIFAIVTMEKLISYLYLKKKIEKPRGE